MTLVNQFGFDPVAWEAAKVEGKQVLAKFAAERRMMPYSDFVKHIHSIQLNAYDVRLNHLLGEILEGESNAGRGMLSALVVHKSGDLSTGSGIL